MKTKKAKVKLNLKNLTVEEKIVFAKQIITSLTGNADFAAPLPALETVSPLIAAAEQANAEVKIARQSVATKVSILDDKLSDLDSVLNQLAAYVESTAKGDETKIKSAGMSVKATSTPFGIPPAPENLLAVAANEGEISLSWDGIKGSKSYVIQMATDISGAGNWAISKISTKSKADVSKLESGIKYWFRVAAVGAAGQGPWSDPATKYAI